jgi:hypothetical protein
MKKHLFILILVLFSLTFMNSCSTDRGEEISKLSQTGKYFHPPAWIQGTWKYAPINPNEVGFSFKFTDSDFINISSGGTETSWTQKFNNSIDNEEVTESITETFYNFIIKDNSGSQTWEFKKISNTELQYRVSPTLNWIKLTKL